MFLRISVWLLSVIILYQCDSGEALRPDKRALTETKGMAVFERGVYYYQRGTASGYLLAMKEFKSLLKKKPRHARGYAMLSLCHSRYGQYLYLHSQGDKAKSYYRKAKLLGEYAIKLDPKGSRGYVALALYYRQVGDWKTLYRHAQKAVELDKAEYEAHAILGDAYSRGFKGRKWNYEKSLMHYRESLRLREDFLPARYNLALLLFAKGRFQDCVVELNLAIKISSEIPQFYYYLSLSHKRLKAYDISLRMIQRAIELDKANPFYHDMEGQVYSLLEKPLNAVKSYKLAISLSGNQPQFWYRLANEYLKLGRKKLSVKLYRKSIELDRDYDMPHLALAELLEEMKCYKLAIREYQIFIRLSLSGGLMEKARKRLDGLKKLIAAKRIKSG